MADFVALYRRRSISETELVAVSVKPRLVERLFAGLLGESKTEQGADDSEESASFLVVRDEYRSGFERVVLGKRKTPTLQRR